MSDFEGICNECGCSCCFILSKSKVFCPACNKEQKRYERHCESKRNEYKEQIDWDYRAHENPFG